MDRGSGAYRIRSVTRLSSCTWRAERIGRREVDRFIDVLGRDGVLKEPARASWVSVYGSLVSW